MIRVTSNQIPRSKAERILVQKKAHAYRTIGETSEAVGVPAHVLRFWETKFSQIRPMKKGGGRRYYRPEDVNLLCGIRVFLYDKEYAIKDLQAFLRSKGTGKVVKVGAITAEPPTNKPTVSAPAPAKPAPTPAAAAPSSNDTLRNALANLQGARSKLSDTLKDG
ncbi:Transcriptional regulator PA2737, MerR family [hydrothermal vent metagenome]|uniref:Transcriptional regulator PA2737, MerR family n=1 Tax=hydrothermal vent metagenome TaxID=652676 RepID=A0A3B0RKY5_9ZZZZ